MTDIKLTPAQERLLQEYPSPTVKYTIADVRHLERLKFIHWVDTPELECYCRTSTGTAWLAAHKETTDGN